MEQRVDYEKQLVEILQQDDLPKKMENKNLDGETNLKMNHLKCSIVGTAYGVNPSEVELASAKQMTFDIGDLDVRLFKEVLKIQNLKS